MKRRLSGVLLKLFVTLFLSLLPGFRAQGQKHTIKFATLAPEGSTWMNTMREFDRELREKTGGEVGFRIYAGGVLGDEKDVLRKIRIGQIHGAGLTGFGLGEIVPDVRLLETPFLLRSTEEADLLLTEFGGYFAGRFEDKGFILLGWTEVGFVHIFTKDPFQSIDELKKMRLWLWQGDPLAETLFKTFQLRGIPLPIIDVMTALQTNMVDGVYNSPLAALSMHWFTKLNCMMEMPLANASGGIVLDDRKFREIPEDQRNVLMSLAQIYLNKLTRLSRDENGRAVEALQNNGIRILRRPKDEDTETFFRLGDEARRSLVGKYYSQELLDKVELSLKVFRESEK